MFKTIKNKKTCIQFKHKVFTNFAVTKSNLKSQDRVNNKKKEFIEWPKFKKCGCKHLANQKYKYTNKICDKYHKNGYISRFHDCYIFVNKRKILLKAIISTFYFVKNASCIIQILTNKVFKTSVI